jgi:hypothetical protein
MVAPCHSWYFSKVVGETVAALVATSIVRQSTHIVYFVKLLANIQ